MKLFEKLNLALERVGFPHLKSDRSFRKIGTGAWHDAYLVYPCNHNRLVIRLRKKVIYGRRETFDGRYLREDYEPVDLYYRLANQGWPGICPEIYIYDFAPDLTFTIESYMGRRLSLMELTTPSAFVYGQRVGSFFRRMHAVPAPIPGFGPLIWNGQALRGEDGRTQGEIWRAQVDAYQTQFDRLSQSNLQFDRPAVKRKLEQALAGRSSKAEPIVLVNRDITPENLIVRRRQFVGLIDPVPLLHHGLRYAAFFIYCYLSYLPNLYDAPRYARYRFDRYRPILEALAGGYLDGYAQNDPVMVGALRLEYFLWALDVAFENQRRLTGEMNDEVRIRAGDKKAIAARLQRCLRELEMYQLAEK